MLARLLAETRTLVHGDLYASNVLARTPAGGGVDVRPVDWEMAGIGPGVRDLAALVAYGWSGKARDRIALAYFEIVSEGAGEEEEEEGSAARLLAARLRISVQWPGRARGWHPPREHARSWVAEVIALADRLVERGVLPRP